LARKILLADDSVTAQNMGRKILTDAGYDVITVNNGSAALKRVAEQKPDLIVLDVYMPGYSGLEVCVRLKDAPETARIPILLTVGKLEPFKPEEATRVRADGFIVKPFEASELLSALTRLEDRMVPSQAEGGRFGSSVSGIERFSGGDPAPRKSEGDDSDTGWKNRLRFPSKKKKEEPEPEPEPDFVTPPSFRDFRRGAGKPPAGSAPFPLSTAPAAAQEPGLVPDIPRDITPEELDALSELVAKLDGVPAPENVASISENIGPDVAATPESRAEAPVPATLPQATKTEADTTIAPAEVKNEPEVPAATEPLNAEAVGAHFAESSVEATPAEVTPAEAAVPEPVVYQTEAAAAQEAAPIDRKDEPTFASAASVISEVQPEAESAAISEPFAPVVEPPAVELTNADSMTETAIQAEEPKVEEAARAEGTSKPDAERPPKTTGPEAPSPSAEELVEALRFLTPSQSITPPTLAEAGAALADELSRGSGSRWIAEATPLSPEEAAGSLETEMFRTFAPSASEQTPTTDELTISGAIEPSIATNETTEINAAASLHVEAPASETAAVAERVGLEQKESSARQTEEVPEEPVAATTFADGIRSQEVESVSATAETVTTAEMDMQTQEKLSSLENGSGGEEAMGNETKGKGGKSTWRQIRSGPPTTASDAVEAAKQSEESPKTMAAAAADNGSDASSIASIVDSVLADLRPKIVEEIAKQLAKK
jgi:CheY-like chemotaxis protein